MTQTTIRRIGIAALVAALHATASDVSAASLDPALVALHQRSFLHGREYFVLRSGRAKLIVQADQADLGPAVMYFLFDADNNHQSNRKDKAFNFAQGQGLAASALEVVLGGFPFTAVGHQTQTRWTTVAGIPAMEAVWWAGGVRVTEQLLAVGEQGVFLRRIQLTSANLGGAENLHLRLALPPGPCKVTQGWLVRDNAACPMALGLASQVAARPMVDQAALELGPVNVAPGQSLTLDTLLWAQMPNIQGAGRSPLTNVPPTAAAPAAAESLGVFDITKELAQTRQTWAVMASLRTSDTTVQEIFDKARFGLPAMVADSGVMDAGIFEYGSQWVRDTSNTLLGMVHAGQFELARRGFGYVLGQMVNADGCTMIASGFDKPDREQFDQMGELLHALKAYRDWSGDDSLLREHRAKLLAMVERPLRPEFRDATGMVHNRREFWERTFDDAYELAYQTYVILGLRDAAALAEPLGAADRAARWLSEAAHIQHSMLELPGRALVDNGHLIKRRAVTGEAVRTLHLADCAADVPMKTESVNLADPDATLALPIAYGLVPPQSALARNTLDELEKLRDGRWFGGGYERYHSSGQCDQPGPWSFATCFILRAQHEAGDFARSRRTLEWLNTVQGGRTGAWFEEIPLLRSQAQTAGILPWTSGEVSLFVVRHLLGVRFEGTRLLLKPALYPNSPPLAADLRFRRTRLQLEIPAAGPIAYALVNDRRVEPRPDGALALPADFEGGRVVLQLRK
ncbi:MAG: hypothetical protein WCP45_15100 [Verrucomicrobiota bacterium]